MERIEKLRSFIEKNHADLFSRHALAMELIKSGDHEGALAEMKELLKVDDGYVGTYYHLAKLYEQLGQTDLAFATYQRGIEIATQKNDQNNLRELRSALVLLNDEMDS